MFNMDSSFASGLLSLEFCSRTPTVTSFYKSKLVQASSSVGDTCHRWPFEHEKF